MQVCGDDDTCRLYCVLLVGVDVSDRSNSAGDRSSAKLAAQKVSATLPVWNAQTRRGAVMVFPATGFNPSLKWHMHPALIEPVHSGIVQCRVVLPRVRHDIKGTSLTQL